MAPEGTHVRLATSDAQRNIATATTSSRAMPSALSTHRNSWFLKMDNLLSATSLPRCYVILVIGTPTYRDLTPLLLSGHYAHSLVIVATHQPPDIPHIVIPALRLLHLSAPLAAENAGAMRFVNVLAWAERVARDWRKYGGSGILELSEDDDCYPRHSSAGLFDDTSVPNSPPANHISMRPHSFHASTMTSSQTRDKRPFDALINFLPSQIPDNALLRQTILTTAISRPFLSIFSPGSSIYSNVFLKCKSILGTLRLSNSERRSPTDLPRTHVEALFSSKSSTARPLSPTASPHLIHVLPRTAVQYPQASMKTVESMEAFLSAFSFASILDAGIGRAPNVANNVRPYIMYSSTFGTALDCALSYSGSDSAAAQPNDAWGCEWTVADIVLSGALDGATSMPGGASPTVDGPAWISGPEDIVLVPSSGHIPASALAVPRRASARRLAVAPSGKENQTEARKQADRQRPDSPYSTYSTSYGHSLIASPPPSFHEHGSLTHEEHATTAMHQDTRLPDIEETPKSKVIPEITQDLREFAGNLLPRRVSLKNVRSLMSGWKGVSAWRFGGRVTEEKTEET